MIGTLALLGYAAGGAWCAPALLVPLAGRGLSARAGLAAWLVAMASVLAAAALALESSLTTVAADWPRLTQTLCRSIAGDACTPAVYESAFYQAGVAVLAIALTAGTALAAWRYGRRVRRSRRQTRAHAEAARIVGRHLAPGIAAAARPGAVVLDDPRPAAYCVAGRPPAIVITSGALALLEPPQLRAVLAHERAHLAQGHNALSTVTRGLAATFPAVPLFARGSTEIARLAEMSADDTAARAVGRPALAAALLAIATGARYPMTGLTGLPADEQAPVRAGQAPVRAGQAPVRAGSAPVPGGTHGALAGLPPHALPRGAMAAAAYAVSARVERMLRPPRPAAARAAATALAALSALLALAPAAIVFLF